MKVIFIYHRFLDKNGNTREIGGVETYLWNLSKVCTEMGMDTVLIQRASKEFLKHDEHLEIHGVHIHSVSTLHGRRQLFRRAISLIDQKKDIIVFGADHCSVPTNNKRAVAIQHGIHWDVPIKFISQGYKGKFGFGQWYDKRKIIKDALMDFDNCYYRVCVDYNFLNWYRATEVDAPRGKVWVITNFVNLGDKQVINKKNFRDRPISIIFARRFEEYRGTKIMAQVIMKLLQKKENIKFTFAGSGPDQMYLEEYFKNTPEVQFIQYLPDEVNKILINYDIAVIPSLGSEGTSLSVAEAMGAGLPVVATAVGGITNMIIDGFNGLLAMPNEMDILNKIEMLIRDKNLRELLGQNAFETAKCSFSAVQWRNSWKKMLSVVSEE